MMPFPCMCVHGLFWSQVVNVPSFVVRLDSQKHIDFALGSALAGGRPGRNLRKRAKAAQKGDDDGADEEEEQIYIQKLVWKLIQYGSEYISK